MEVTKVFSQDRVRCSVLRSRTLTFQLLVAVFTVFSQFLIPQRFLQNVLEKHFKGFFFALLPVRKEVRRSPGSSSARVHAHSSSSELSARAGGTRYSNQDFFEDDKGTWMCLLQRVDGFLGSDIGCGCFFLVAGRHAVLPLGRLSRAFGQSADAFGRMSFPWFLCALFALGNMVPCSSTTLYLAVYSSVSGCCLWNTVHWILPEMTLSVGAMLGVRQWIRGFRQYLAFG